MAGGHYSPATQIKPGERLSVGTEFKAGGVAPNKMAVGSVRVRIETHSEKPRAWVKVGPGVWRKRAVVVWEDHHGKLARGTVVHHKDRNSLNDAIENLQALTRAQHTREHQKELAAAIARAVLGLEIP